MKHRSCWKIQPAFAVAAAGLPINAPGDGFRCSKASAETMASNRSRGMSAAARLASTWQPEQQTCSDSGDLITQPVPLASKQSPSSVSALRPAGELIRCALRAAARHTNLHAICAGCHGCLQPSSSARLHQRPCPLVPDSRSCSVHIPHVLRYLPADCCMLTSTAAQVRPLQSAHKHSLVHSQLPAVDCLAPLTGPAVARHVNLKELRLAGFQLKWSPVLAGHSTCSAADSVGNASHAAGRECC